MIKADKIEYKDGIGCCLWHQEKDSPEGTGICWDFSYDDVDEIIKVLQELKTKTAEPYTEERRKEDESWDAKDKIQEEKEKKWYIRLLRFVDDFGFQVTPFQWKLGTSKNHIFTWKNRGLAIGPFKITW